jgi:hypothetical protein
MGKKSGECLERMQLHVESQGKQAATCTRKDPECSCCKPSALTAARCAKPPVISIPHKKCLQITEPAPVLTSDADVNPRMRHVLLPM